MSLERLSAVLESLERFVVDDEKAAEYDRIVQEARDYDQRSQRADRLERLGVPLRQQVRDAIVSGKPDALKPTRSYRAVQKWLTHHDAPATLVLCGGTGCGKSVAAAWALANGPASSAWRTANDTIRVFAGFFKESADEQRLMLRCKLLVLDDVGTELDAERMQAALVEILEFRKGLKTLISTNLAQQDWLLRYADPRLHSRLKECAAFVPDNGPDLRGAK